MTEAEATEAGIRYDSRTLPPAHVPRALANRDTRGLVELVADTANGRLIGVHVIADGAGDLITATYALTSGMTTEVTMDVLVLIGRILFVLVFLGGAVAHLTRTQAMGSYAASRGFRPPSRQRSPAVW
jgi:hypothetical protein